MKILTNFVPNQILVISKSGKTKEQIKICKYCYTLKSTLGCAVSWLEIQLEFEMSASALIAHAQLRNYKGKVGNVVVLYYDLRKNIGAILKI